jgi:hypothetical protein
MNAKQLIAALPTVAAAGELSTSDVDYPKMPAFVGKLTRAQVIAELLEARKNGDMPTSEVSFDVARTSHHVLPSSH